MSERACVRGCTQKDVHYATCRNNSDAELIRRTHAEDTGLEYVAPCRGCAPRECRDGSLICDRCFGRMRGLLDDSGDLLGRMMSLADPSKATPTDQLRLGGTQVEAPAPVPADILDAIIAVRAAVASFDAWGRDLAAISNDRDAVLWLGELVLTRHQRDQFGVRDAWSVQDAVDQWGLERRDPGAAPFTIRDDEDGEVVVLPHAEWGDPLLARHDVAKRVGVTERTLQVWEKKELIRRVATTHERQNRTAWFRLSEVLAVRAEQEQMA